MHISLKCLKLMREVISSMFLTCLRFQIALEDIENEHEARDSEALQGPMTRGRLRRLQEEGLQKLGVLIILEDLSP
ncbi:hypothetical protein CR513_25436, partial [Mucuna pruriens]